MTTTGSLFRLGLDLPKKGFELPFATLIRRKVYDCETSRPRLPIWDGPSC